MTTESCPHPYFSALETWFFVAPLALLALAIFLAFMGSLLWFATRSWMGALIVAGAALLGAVGFGAFGDIVDWFVVRWQFPSDDLARLQRELQDREADLERYGQEHPGVSTSRIGKDYLASRHRRTGFYFSDPEVPPVYFKVSDWRDAVPRVVVSFGCGNNVVFNSTTMGLEQLD